MNTKAELIISLIVFSYCEHWLHVLFWELTLALPFKSPPTWNYLRSEDILGMQDVLLSWESQGRLHDRK